MGKRRRSRTVGNGVVRVGDDRTRSELDRGEGASRNGRGCHICRLPQWSPMHRADL